MTVIEFGSIWLLSITLQFGSINVATVNTSLEFDTVAACRLAGEVFISSLGSHNAPMVWTCARQPRA